MRNSRYDRLDNLINLYALLNNGLEGKSKKSLMNLFKKENEDVVLSNFVSLINTFIVNAIDMEMGVHTNLYTGMFPGRIDVKEIKKSLGITQEKGV